MTDAQVGFALASDVDFTLSWLTMVGGGMELHLDVHYPLSVGAISESNARYFHIPVKIVRLTGPNNLNFAEMVDDLVWFTPMPCWEKFDQSGSVDHIEINVASLPRDSKGKVDWTEVVTALEDVHTYEEKTSSSPKVVTAPAPTKSETTTCSICLSAEASTVANPCGHLVCCPECRRTSVYEVLLAQNDANAKEVPKKRDLQTRQPERTKLPRPLCGATCTLLVKHKYKGEIFNDASSSGTVR